MYPGIKKSEPLKVNISRLRGISLHNLLMMTHQSLFIMVCSKSQKLEHSKSRNLKHSKSQHSKYRTLEISNTRNIEQLYNILYKLSFSPCFYIFLAKEIWILNIILYSAVNITMYEFLSYNLERRIIKSLSLIWHKIKLLTLS